MPDYRRTRDYQPDLQEDLDAQLQGLRRWDPLSGALADRGLDPAYSDRYLASEGSKDTLGSLAEALQNAQSRTESIDAGLGRQQDLIQEQKQNLNPLFAQAQQQEQGPGLMDRLSEGLGSIGGAVSSGLGALVPSQNTLDSIGMRLQNMGAAYHGIVPPYLQQAKIMHEMGQANELMQMRRQEASYKLRQEQELKRGHDLQLLEKVMANPRGHAMLEQLGNDPNFSLNQQAKMLHKGMKESDMGSFSAYREFIPEEVQQKFLAGQLPAHELGAWLDEARTAAKESAKINAKNTVLTRAMNKQADQRTPYEQQLVEEHQAQLEVEKLKPKKMQSEIDENTAQAEHYRKQAETGSDKTMGVDREAITQELYGPGTRYSTLDQKKMKMVNDRLLNFQGTQQLNKSMAVQQAQLQIPDKPSQGEREKASDDLAALDSIDNLNKLYSSDFVGPVRGRVGAGMETFGGITEEEARFRAANTTLKNHVIKLITGAQMSEPEANRILGQVPDMTNPPEVWEARLKETRKNIKFLADRRREVLKGAGVDVSGLPEVGKKKSKSVQPPNKQGVDQIQSVLDEVLGK